MSILISGCAAGPPMGHYEPGGEMGAVRILQPYDQVMQANKRMGSTHGYTPIVYPAGTVAASAGIGGLLGVMIVGSISRGRHRVFVEAAEPLWEHMEGIRYDEMLLNELQHSRPWSDWTQDHPIDIIRTQDQESGVPSGIGASLLSIEPYPMMSSNFRTLYTRVALRYYERPDHFDPAKVRIRRRFNRYFDVLVSINDRDIGLSREEHRDLWLALSREEFADIIQLSMNQAVRMILFSLETIRPARRGGTYSADDVFSGGYQVHTDGDFVWLYRDSVMTAVHRNALK